MTETFTINADDLFTAHKQGCTHLRLASSTFEVDAELTRESIRVAVDGLGFEDSDLDLAPCLRGIK